MANTFIPTEQEFMELKKEISEIKNIVLEKQKITQEIYDNADLMKLLKVSRRTLSTWRSTEPPIIEFSQIGSKLYYTKEAVEKFLQNYRVRGIGK